MRHFGGSNRGLVLQLVQLARLVGYGGCAGLGLPVDEGWRRHYMELNRAIHLTTAGYSSTVSPGRWKGGGQ